MLEHAEAGGAQPLDGAFEQQRVLEDAAGQRDGGQPGGLAQGDAGAADGGGDAVVEASGDDGGVDPGGEVVGGGADEVAALDDERAAVGAAGGGDGGGVDARLGGVGALFEFDRRLPLVRDRVADAEQGRDGVEEAAGRWR